MRVVVTRRGGCRPRATLLTTAHETCRRSSSPSRADDGGAAPARGARRRGPDRGGRGRACARASRRSRDAACSSALRGRAQAGRRSCSPDGLIDRLLLFIAPLIVGRGAPDLFAAPAVDAIAEALAPARRRVAAGRRRPAGQRPRCTKIRAEPDVHRHRRGGRHAARLRVGEKSAALEVPRRASRKARPSATASSPTASASRSRRLRRRRLHGRRHARDRAAHHARRAPRRRPPEPRARADAALAPRRAPRQRAHRRRRHGRRAYAARRTPWSSSSTLPRPSADVSVEQGSIALDGVSLTIVAVEGGRLARVADPAHGGRHHAGAAARRGVRVNLEADVIAKYVYAFVARAQARRPDSPGRSLRKRGSE